MVRNVAIGFAIITANILVGDFGATGAEPYTPPQQAPHPLSDRQAVAGSRDAQQAAENDSHRKLLEQKLAERDRLQREIDELRRTTGTPQQILVKIRALEINRSKLRRLGVDWATADGEQVSVTSAAGLLNLHGTNRGETFEFAVASPGDAFHGLLRGLEANNIGKVLAEPTIVVVSGRPASFQFGGKFPMPAGPKSDKAVEFVNFGTQVDMLATSLGNDKVRMELRVRVSEPDFSRPITVENQSVPMFNVRQLDTACELPFGQSAVFTGFVQRRVMTIRRIDGQERQETEEFETLFLATPEVVAAAETVATPEFTKAYDAPAAIK